MIPLHGVLDTASDIDIDPEYFAEQKSVIADDMLPIIYNQFALLLENSYLTAI